MAGQMLAVLSPDPFMAVILLVDDEEIVIRVATTALQRAGHTVHTARSGAEADRIGAELPHIDALIVNHRIAPEKGRNIAERLVRKHADAKVMHISGYPRAHLEQEDGFFPGAIYLAKPFTPRQMQESVAALLAPETRSAG